MAHERAIQRLRSAYGKLLRLYPKQYRERFAEPMAQTFRDLLRERAAQSNLFAFALWIFLETFAGIVKENIRTITMQNLAKRSAAYRFAFAIAAIAALLLLWFNLAVAESNDSPGPLFFAVVAALLIGTAIARFKPQGMAYALFATALAQMLVAVIAVVAWGQYVEILAFNGFFILLWLGSAVLFQRARRFS